MVVLVVVSKKATRHFAINIGLYNDLSEERSAAHQLKYIILKMKSQSNREDSDFKDAELEQSAPHRHIDKKYALEMSAPHRHSHMPLKMRVYPLKSPKRNVAFKHISNYRKRSIW